MTELEYLGTKLVTIEVILETLIEELDNKNVIKTKTFDKQIIKKLKKIQKELEEEKTEIDFSSMFFGQKGEA